MPAPDGTGGAIYGRRTEGNGNSVLGAGLCWQSWETVLRSGANRRHKGKTLQTYDHIQNQPLRGCNKKHHKNKCKPYRYESRYLCPKVPEGW